MPEYLTDEQAAMIWSGQTASLSTDSTPEIITAPAVSTAEEAVKVEIPEENKTPNLFKEDDISSALAGDDTDEDEDEPTVTEEATKTDQNPEAPKKTPGRKSIDLVTVAEQLIKDEVLMPFEDGFELKTVEDVKDLIKLNLESREKGSEEGWWKSKIESYSPQVQAILHYAEQGGQDVDTFLGAIRQIEQSSNLTAETEKGQEAIVRQVLEMKGFDEDEIEDQVSTLRDLDKLKAKAEKFLPELNSMNQRRVTSMMREQEQRQEQAREATRQYLTTIQDTLSKDTIAGVKLQRDEKAKIFESLANNKHTSLSGAATNNFVKALEEMQFGKNANYDEFLSIVHHAIDPEGYRNKIKESLKNEVKADTIRQLKSSKTTSANYDDSAVGSNRTTTSKTVSRNSFKNPFA